MKEYKKNIELDEPGKVMPPINFTLSQQELVLDDEAVLVYDNVGKFLGHVKQEVMKKYLYGWLYYATKRAFQIRSLHLNENCELPAKVVVHKKSGNFGLVFQPIYVEDKHLIDKNNKADLIQRAISEIKEVSIKNWDFELPDYDSCDEFNLGVGKLAKHHEKEIRALLKKHQDDLITNLTARMEAEANLKKEANLMGIPVEF